MERTHEPNVETAADPQAIATLQIEKLPLWDNDPTRNVTRREGARRMLVMGLGTLALLAMLIAATLALVQRGAT